jgi:tetratricopeptide (TPR) repeat protein
MNYKDLAKDTTAWNNKGTAFVKIGRYYEAIKYFDKVLEIDPKDGVS